MDEEPSKSKVLWIEDDSLKDLTEQLGPIYVDGRHDIVIALDATTGFRYLLDHEFSAVIVDIRLGPGDDPKWIDIYTGSRKDNAAARLGLHVLREVLGLREIPTWIRPSLFGVFTVESRGEVEEDLRELGINMDFYRHKSKDTTDSYTLLELIDAITERKNREE